MLAPKALLSRDLLADQPMSRMQIAAIAVMVALNAMDGFDVLSISFAAPGISKSWGIDQAALGLVLSMELLGMAAGSLVLGRAADRIGRRNSLLCCLTIIALGMGFASLSRSVVELCCCRILTGVGIGGVLAAANALTAEYANARSRGLSVSLMAIGYPIGAVAGGLIASLLLRHGEWPRVFQVGFIATITLIPIVYVFVPESVEWLCKQQPSGALNRVNRTLKRFKLSAVSTLPVSIERMPKAAFTELFAPGQVRTTLSLTAGYFFHITSFYFILKWAPKLAADLGYTHSAAAGVLVWTNIGGVIGGTTLGFLSRRGGLLHLTMTALFMSTIMMALFGWSQSSLEEISIVCCITGFFTNAGVVGLYGLLAQMFPTEVRATGTGFAIGVGRGGAMLGPILVGSLFRSGASLQMVALSMGASSLIGCIALSLMIPRQPERND